MRVSFVGASLLAKNECQAQIIQLTERLREQARSHGDLRRPQQL
ncbi:hypothetical protein FHY08_001886 [Pseudomonas koreensis]|nr:hypothetical protein [Pseudomonas koreensis]